MNPRVRDSETDGRNAASLRLQAERLAEVPRSPEGTEGVTPLNLSLSHLGRALMSFKLSKPSLSLRHLSRAYITLRRAAGGVDQA